MAWPDDGIPIEEQIINALMTRLRTIQPPAYRYAVVDVLLCESDFDAAGETPAIAVLPMESAIDDKTNYALYHDLRVGIGAAIKIEGPAETWRREIKYLIGDITVAVLTEPQFGELASSSRFTAQRIPPRDPQDELAIAELELMIRYHHIYANPSLQWT